MRRLSFGSPAGNKEAWFEDALREIERASAEDIEATVSGFTTTGTLTERRTIDAGAATLAQLRDFVCTLVHDIKKRGQKRSQ